MEKITVTDLRDSEVQSTKVASLADDSTSHLLGLSKNRTQLIKQAFVIRKFEEKLLSLYDEGKIDGTIHTCIGQEWIGIAAADASRPDDYFLSNHRGHGHFLARYNNPTGLFAEVMGRKDGICCGMGGSQHLWADKFISNGIQGGLVPVAAGIAMSFKLQGKKNVALVFIGDGTLGQGVLYESLNIAAKWSLPIIIVVENNGIAQTTPIQAAMAGSVESRAKAFDIDFVKLASWDWEALIEGFVHAFSRSRGSGKPLVVEVETFRLKPHSKGDDTRPQEQVQLYSKRDPLNLLLEQNPELSGLIAEIENTIDEAARKALASDFGCFEKDIRFKPQINDIRWGTRAFQSDRFVSLLNQGISQAMHQDERVLFLGEDVLSPYGGAFKAAKNLSTDYPDRVFTTPISEPAIVGIGTGLALQGYIPLVEIMFGDFLTLCFDQILNHACKFPFMYGGKVKVPLVIRTPMGGYRGYGPTHSQSLEKHFQGIPNLHVAALNIRYCPKEFYKTLCSTIENPTLVIENKVLYTKYLRTNDIHGFNLMFSDERYPTLRIAPKSKSANVTIFCYGGMLELAEDALIRSFREHEVLAEVVCPIVISPLNIQPVIDSVKKTGRLLTIEEGGTVGGIGAEVVLAVLESGVAVTAVKRVGIDNFIPTSMKLEAQLLPSVEKIVTAVGELVYGKSNGF